MKLATSLQRIPKHWSNASSTANIERKLNKTNNPLMSKELKDEPDA
jgi:hypothetical protein